MHKILLSRGSFAKMLHQENPFAYSQRFFAEGGGTPEEKEVALLAKIGEKVKTEIETRGYTNKTEVEGLVKAALTGLNLEALRKYGENDVQLAETVKNISTELEKVKNLRTAGKKADKEVKLMLRNALNTMLFPEEGKQSELELLMRSKGGPDNKGAVVLNIRTAATMTTANTINENNYPLEMIESMNILDGVVKIRRGTQYIFDFATVTTVAELEQYTTWLEETDEQGAFAIVAEGAVKPLISGALVRNFAKAKKVAGKKVVTEEFTKFRAKAYSIITSLINDKILRDYAAILTADLQAQAASYVGTTLDGTFATPNRYDAIAAVSAQIETLNFFPDTIVLHPQDKWILSMQKDAVGQYYMMIPMYTADGMVKMMGLNVVTSTYQALGSFTLGEAGLFKIEQETLTVRMGYGIDVTMGVAGGVTVVTAVSSDLDQNQMRIIVETWFKDYIATNHIGSFVTASFATVIAALQAA